MNKINPVFILKGCKILFLGLLPPPSGGRHSGGSNCGRLLQACSHLCRVNGDALGAVVCLVDANETVSKLKPGGEERKLSEE